MKAIHSIFFLLLLVGTTSCLTYEDVQLESFDGVQVENFAQKSVKLRVNATIFNPNGYKIKIKKSDLDVLVDGTKIGIAKTLDKVVLPKKATESQSVLIELTLDGKTALMAVMPKLMKGSSEVQIKGKVKAKALGIGKKFDVDFKHKLSARDVKGLGLGM